MSRIVPRQPDCYISACKEGPGYHYPWLHSDQWKRGESRAMVLVLTIVSGTGKLTAGCVALPAYRKI
jgi:hypothetical protein